MQPSLFDSARKECVPFSGSRPETRETSKAAGEAARCRVQNDRYWILSAIKDCTPRGLTDDEIQRFLKMSGNTERPRRRELEQAGLIKPAGTRKTASGRAAVVWVAA